MLKEGDKNCRTSFAFREFILAWSVSGRVFRLLNWAGGLVRCSFLGLRDKENTGLLWCLWYGIHGYGLMYC